MSVQRAKSDRRASLNLAGYLASQTVSMVSDNILWLAVGMWVNSATGSSASASVALLIFSAGLLTGPLAGVVVDRVKRRPVILITNAVTALAVLVLCRVHGVEQLNVVYLVMFTYGVSNAILGPAHGALLQTVASTDQVRHIANAIQVARPVIRMVTPLIGVFIYSIGGLPLVSAVCAAGFITDSAILATLCIRESLPAPPPKGLFHEFIAGAAHIASHRLLRVATGHVACVMFATGLARSSMFAVAHDTFGDANRAIGFFNTAQGLGGIAAGLCLHRLFKTTPDDLLVKTGVALASGALLLESLSSQASVISGMALIGAAGTFVNVGAASLFLRQTDSSLVGRTDAILLFTLFLFQFAATGIGTACVAAHQYYIAMWMISAVLMFVFARGVIPRIVDATSKPPMRDTGSELLDR
jgi:MFS family permease